MAQWVLSVAGIAILSVMADVILPNGQNRKYIKTVIGVVVTLVVAQPVVSFFGGEGLTAFYREKESRLAPQQGYLTFVENGKNADTAKIRAALVSADFTAPTVTFSAKTCRYTVNLTEARTQELEAAAYAAIAAVETKFPADLRWNNTE